VFGLLDLLGRSFLLAPPNPFGLSEVEAALPASLGLHNGRPFDCAQGER